MGSRGSASCGVQGAAPLAGSKGQRPWRGPGATPLAGATVNTLPYQIGNFGFKNPNLVEFCNQITLRLICSKQIKNDFFFNSISRHLKNPSLL